MSKQSPAPAIYKRIRKILEAARAGVARTVNTTQVIANWLIGREIVEDEQHGKKRADYGRKLLADLSVRMLKDFGRGYSVDNLEAFRLFYLAYPSLISETLRRKSLPDQKSETASRKSGFCNELCRIGIQKLYPDAIAHSLYYALRYKKRIILSPSETKGILALDDGITTVLLLEYAKKWKLKHATKLIRDKSNALKLEDERTQDRQWLLIYQTWSEDDLRCADQDFLGHLKSNDFKFYTPP